MKIPHLKLIVFATAILAGVLFVSFSGYEEHISMQTLQQRIEDIRKFVDRHYTVSVGAYILCFAGLTLIFPLAFIMVFTGGVLYGIFEGSLYATAATGISAAATFAFSRYFAGAWIQQRFDEKLRTFNDNFRRYGIWYLILVRIIAVAPFCVINLIAGITRVRFRTFLWTTCLGSLPNILILTILANTVWLI